jgi:uncharacterized protein
MPADKKNIWVLKDDRISNFKQIEAISNFLSSKSTNIINKSITYNKTIFLPNFARNCFQIKSVSLKLSDIINKDFPDLILSAGRRCASIALQIKKQSGNKSKIIQLMRPNPYNKNFDFIITPKHDNYKYANYENITTPNSINNKLLEESLPDWPILNQLTKPKIALIVGGSTKKANIRPSHFAKMSETISNKTAELDGSILVTTSRRTGIKNEQIILSHLSDPHYIFTWQEKLSTNPYYAILAQADYIIITGDSISMISDACATGKPVYIYDKKFGNSKHRKFQQYLYDKKIAKPYTEFLKKPESWNYTPINEAKNIADIIKKKFL